MSTVIVITPPPPEPIPAPPNPDDGTPTCPQPPIDEEPPVGGE